MPKVWVVRAGGGKYLDEFTSEPHPRISFGFGIKEDITALTDPDQIEERCRKHNPDRLPLAGRFAKQIRDFLHEIRPGDVVLTPMSDHTWLRHGVIEEGSPYFEELAYEDGDFLGHHRPVKWHPEPIYRYDCDPIDQEPMRRRPTIVPIADDSDAFWGRYSPGSNAKSAKSGAQTVSLDVLTALNSLVEEFDPWDAQDLVADLLAAMGCVDLEVSPPGPDGGVDIRAVRSDILTPEVSIFVQVKRYKWGRNIGKKAVRDLRSGIKFGSRGVFITTSIFTKGAKEVARESEYPYIALIDGPNLIALLREHWQRLSEEHRQRLADALSPPADHL